MTQRKSGEQNVHNGSVTSRLASTTPENGLLGPLALTTQLASDPFGTSSLAATSACESPCSRTILTASVLNSAV